MSNGVIATIFGIALTLVLAACSFVAFYLGYFGLSNWLFWQHFQFLDVLFHTGPPPNTILSSFDGPPSITPSEILEFVASLLVGFVIYGGVAYIVLRVLRRST